MIEAGIQTIKDCMLMNHWSIWCLFVISVIYLAFKAKTRIGSNYVMASVVGILVICNPIFAGLVGEYFFEANRYFRLFWILPAYLLISFAFAEFCVTRTKRVVLASFAGILIIAVCGKWIYTGNFVLADNLFKLPKSVVLICEYLNETEEYKEGKLKISVDPSLSSYIRQYDAGIMLQFGRTPTGYTRSERAEVAYRELSSEQGADVQSLVEAYKIDSCKYIVLKEGQVDCNALLPYGYVQSANIEGYEIYKDELLEAEPTAPYAENSNVILAVENHEVVEYIKRTDGTSFKIAKILLPETGGYTKVIYDENTGFFYALDAKESTIYLLQEIYNKVRIVDHKILKEDGITDIFIEKDKFVVKTKTGELFYKRYKDRSFLE